MHRDPLRILLADDDEDDRLFFKEAFDEIRIKTEVITVNDGVELMDYLNDIGSPLPDILFLDLNMPRKSGMECLAEMRDCKRLMDLSIAIYSTSNSEKDIDETFVKGANVYIKKPNDFILLKKVLSEVITINWQYITNGLNRENFLLSIS